jgi:hypothetical protein
MTIEARKGANQRRHNHCSSKILSSEVIGCAKMGKVRGLVGRVPTKNSQKAPDPPQYGGA